MILNEVFFKILKSLLSLLIGFYEATNRLAIKIT